MTDKTNHEQKKADLEKHIKYIEKVLKEKQDELFCLLAEEKQTK